MNKIEDDSEMFASVFSKKDNIQEKKKKLQHYEERQGIISKS